MKEVEKRVVSMADRRRRRLKKERDEKNPPPKKKYYSKKKERRTRAETDHISFWIRKDINRALGEFSKKTGTPKQRVINELLFNFLLKEKLEKRTGLPSSYTETEFVAGKGTVREGEANTLKGTDDEQND